MGSGTKRLISYNNARIISSGKRPRLTGIICDPDNGSIVDMGQDPYLFRRLMRRAEAVDLEGRWVMPGLTDGHIHFVNWCLMLSRPDLSQSRSLADSLRIIKQYASACRQDEWLTGTGWDSNLWPEGRLPHRSDLDRICPQNPAALWSKDWHTIWMNSLALKRLGIFRTTGSVKGGRIERDGRGQPSGILREEAANHFYQRIPPPSAEMVFRAIARGQQRFHALGLTGFHTMEGPQEYGWLHRLEVEGKLRLRGVLYYRQQYLDSLIGLGMASGFGSRWLKIGGLKLFVDGALGSQTAWLLKPYQNSRSRGMAVISKSELGSWVRRASQHGLACAIHAIGDAANRTALDVIEDARKFAPGLRHRIEHCQLVAPADIGRFSRLGIVASVQPCHCPADLDLVEKYWGARGRFSYPFGSLLRAGAALALGTDAPIEDPDPWRNIQAAVTRQRIPPDRPSFHPQECLTLGQAIRAYTLGAAYASGDEHWKGKLASGLAADFICLDDDPYQIRPDKLHQLRVSRTVVAGRTVYEK